MNDDVVDLKLDEDYELEQLKKKEHENMMTDVNYWKNIATMLNNKAVAAGPGAKVAVSNSIEYARQQAAARVMEAQSVIKHAEEKAAAAKAVLDAKAQSAVTQAEENAQHMQQLLNDKVATLNHRHLVAENANRDSSYPAIFQYDP